MAMNTIVRKIYTLPGVWQLFTVPALAASFTMRDLQQRSERPRRGYLLFWLLLIAEFAALAAWYAFYFSGKAETLDGLLAGGAFFFAGGAVVVLSLLHTRRRPVAFRAFLIEQGYAAHRPELRSAE
jgi:hypothetical protein